MDRPAAPTGRLAEVGAVDRGRAQNQLGLLPDGVIGIIASFCPAKETPHDPYGYPYLRCRYAPAPTLLRLARCAAGSQLSRRDRDLALAALVKTRLVATRDAEAQALKGIFTVGDPKPIPAWNGNAPEVMAVHAALASFERFNRTGGMPPAIGSLLYFAKLMERQTFRVPADFRTVQAAVDATRYGGRIILAAGDYKEEVWCDRDIIIEAPNGRASLLKVGIEGASGSLGAHTVLLVNLDVECPETEKMWACHVVDGARLVMINCTARAPLHIGVIANCDAQLRLIRCSINTCAGDGVSIKHGSQCALDGCNLSGNRGSGLAVDQCDEEVIATGCRIIDNKGNGVYASKRDSDFAPVRRARQQI